jgi:hypothetical protein
VKGILVLMMDDSLEAKSLIQYKASEASQIIGGCGGLPDRLISGYAKNISLFPQPRRI